MDTSTLSPPTGSPAETTSQLDIKPKRSWKTWQVVLFCTLSLLVGMRIGYDGESTSRAITTGTVANGGSGLPPDPNATSTSAPAPATGDPGATATPGDPAGPGAGTGAGQAAAGPGADGAAAAPPQLVLEVKPQVGPYKSQAFTLAPGAWKLGWSFNCRKQGGTGLFSVTFQRPDGEVVGADPAVDQDGTDGTGVDEFTSEGEHVMVVNSDCLWAAKVTGVPA